MLITVDQARLQMLVEKGRRTRFANEKASVFKHPNDSHESNHDCVTMLPNSLGYLSQASTDQLALFGDRRIELV